MEINDSLISSRENGAGNQNSEMYNAAEYDGDWVVTDMIDQKNNSESENKDLRGELRATYIISGNM